MEMNALSHSPNPIKLIVLLTNFLGRFKTYHVFAKTRCDKLMMRLEELSYNVLKRINNMGEIKRAMEERNYKNGKTIEIMCYRNMY